MVQSQVFPRAREGHGLQRLTQALEALEAGQRTQQTRETQIQQQLTTQAQALTRLQTGYQWLGWAIGALGGLVLALGGLVGWQAWHPPALPYIQTLGALDATLGQQWGSLPKPVQEAISATYCRVGLVPHGQRK